MGQLLDQVVPHVDAPAESHDQQKRITLTSVDDVDPMAAVRQHELFSAGRRSGRAAEKEIHLDPIVCVVSALRGARRKSIVLLHRVFAVRPATMPTCPPGRRTISACETTRMSASTPSGGAMVSFSADTDRTGIVSRSRSMGWPPTLAVWLMNPLRPGPNSRDNSASIRPEAGTTSSTQVAMVRMS